MNNPIKKTLKINVIGIIPARMASTRFPGKPLARIREIPMVGHVYFRSKMCKALNEVYVATCDKEIADYVESIGAKVIMTAPTHQRASDRAAEAMLKIEHRTGQRVDVAVMIQGDEPMIYPEMIEEAIRPILEDDTLQVINLMAPLRTREEHEDPNVIKVITDINKFALYFSREPLPSRKRFSKELPMYKQVTIIPFKRDFLIKFNKLDPTPLEIIESIDMLRVLEHGYKVKMVPTEFETYGVDTPHDLRKVKKLMETDKLFPIYREIILR